MTGSVLAIAHRAGNEPGLLRDAVGAGADIVEADIWPHRGRLEVRHLKTMGPLPLLWDRWKLAPAWTPRLLVAELLEHLPAGVGIMFDMKGHDLVAAGAVADIAAYLAFEHRLYVCARDWSLLEPFNSAGTVLIHSAGTAREVSALWPLIEAGTCSAISIHQKLLTPAFTQRLRRHAHTVITWPVNDNERMRELVGWGVNGITTDNLDVVRAIHSPTPTPG